MFSGVSAHKTTVFDRVEITALVQSLHGSVAGARSLEQSSARITDPGNCVRTYFYISSCDTSYNFLEKDKSGKNLLYGSNVKCGNVSVCMMQ